MPANTWLTSPDETEHALSEAVTIERTKNDLTLSSPTVSREHTLLTFREGRLFVAHAKRRALCRVARQRGWVSGA
jgi:hypothetical protein